MIPDITGEWNEDGEAYVFMFDKRLDPAKSLGLRNHSPDGFAWGYYGSGPSQLALAILLELTSEQVALHFYQDFKTEIIAHLPVGEDFSMPFTRVQNWLRARGVSLAPYLARKDRYAHRSI